MSVISMGTSHSCQSSTSHTNTGSINMEKRQVKMWVTNNLIKHSEISLL